MTDPYLHNREFFGSVSGNYRVAATDTGLIALVAPIPAHTLFIQKLHIEVTTITGAELWTFQDGAAIPIVPSVSAAAVAHFDFDFGPDGVPCSQATGFQLNITGAVGAIGWITWEGFKKLTLGTAASASGGAPPASDVGTQTLVIVKPGIAAGSADGLVLQNPTPATAGVPVQDSPRLRLEGQAWDTDDGVSRPMSFIFDVVPFSAGTIGGTLRIFSLDPITGALVAAAQLGHLGSLTLAGDIGVGPSRFFFWNGRVELTSSADAQLVINDWNLTKGVLLDVNTDAVLRLRNRADSAYAQLSAASVRGNAVTFANLPAAPVEGMLCAVTDASVNTWGSIIAGGGANHVLAYYNGTNWTVAGK
jgi:hypothetical protein